MLFTYLLNKLCCGLNQHCGGIAVHKEMMFGFCPLCELRSPYTKHVNNTWGISLLRNAIAEGNTFYDKSLINKNYKQVIGGQAVITSHKDNNFGKHI